MKVQLHFSRRVRKYQGGYVAIPYIIAAVSAAGAVVSAVNTRNQGIAAANQANMQARLEGDSAKQQEINRRQQLMRALSTQNASAGAGGIETSGSFAAVARRQINENKNDLLTIDSNTSVRQSMLAAQASNSRASGNLGAAVSLLDGATKAYNAAPGG